MAANGNRHPRTSPLAPAPLASVCRGYRDQPFILIPIYVIAVAAFTPRSVLNAFPKPLLPLAISTDTMQAFLATRGVGQSVITVVIVGGMTMVWRTAGTPAGYALARFASAAVTAQLLILMTRAFPIAILAVPLTSRS